jgi:hypothetical protein
MDSEGALRLVQSTAIDLEGVLEGGACNANTATLQLLYTEGRQPGQLASICSQRCYVSISGTYQKNAVHGLLVSGCCKLHASLHVRKSYYMGTKHAV